ncbi:MAG: serine hydrolase [Polyangiaceae bacterium]
MTYSRGYGVLKQGEEQHVLATTVFDMASLSKFVGALTMMKLDSDGAYDFDVDDSIVDNAIQDGHIDQWLTAGEANPGKYGFANRDVATSLTTAHFMRHQTDFIQSGGSPGLSAWLGSRSGARPGSTCLAGTAPRIRVTTATRMRTTTGAGKVTDYDSVNFLIPKRWRRDVSHGGLRAHREVLDHADGSQVPARLHFLSRHGHRQGGLAARPEWSASQVVRVPWTFAGGVYAALKDYAELMILAMNEGRDSSGVQRIPAAAVDRMLTADDGNVGFGLFGDRNGDMTEGSDNAFRHNGSHSSRARTAMCGNATRDEGIVITLNIEGGDLDKNGSNDSLEFINWIRNEYVTATGFNGDRQ